MTPEHSFAISHQLPESDILGDVHNSLADTLELATIEHQDLKFRVGIHDAFETETMPTIPFVVAPLTKPVLTHRGISIVLPAWNEEEIIAETVMSVVDALQTMTSDFEVIVVDDGSVDRTGEIADALAQEHACVRAIHNRPNQGYGGALNAGFQAASKELLFFMDADGQFAIGDLALLITSLEQGKGDVALGYRARRRDPLPRLLNARAWKLLVSSLFRFHVRDIDCAFKLMPTALVRKADLQSRGAMINTELLAKFARMDVSIAQVPVGHFPRQKGKATGANVRVILRAFRELFQLYHQVRRWTPAEETPAIDLAAVIPDHPKSAGQDHELPNSIEQPATRRTRRNIFRRIGDWIRTTDRVPPSPPSQDEAGASDETRAKLAQWLDDVAAASDERSERESNGYAPVQTCLQTIDDQFASTFSTLPQQKSARRTITKGQVFTLLALVLAWNAAIWLIGMPLLIGTIAAITVVYLGDLLATLVLALHTIHTSPERRIDDTLVESLADHQWPRYTVLCPLYREAAVVPQFVNAMKAMDYPHDRLQILFLTEEDDHATRDAIAAMDLPACFEILTVPDGQPRTKPRACNYGLMMATGDFVVIYDAEDKPDRLQLKKAVLAFALESDDVACVQAKLNFYNPNQNLLTRWFTTEYTLWFDLTLPGLQWARAALPLGGTSNHFRASILRQIGAWDPFNVTEDCDLGLRLAQHQLRTVMLDSTTYEEANSAVKNWIRQRSRWIKGYLQTYLVHMRRPMRYIRERRLRDFISLQAVVGARSAMLYVNPLMWVMLMIYLGFRPFVAGTFHVLYPAPVFYMGMSCFVFGNFIYMYTYLVACARRRQYNLMLFALCVPVYWAMMSVAASVAFIQLLYVPHYWEKTQHGLHLQAAKLRHMISDESQASASIGRITQTGIRVIKSFDATTYGDTAPSLPIIMPQE
jgi:cellulose synthase/poly-beta-1,6-N-acetylglucosamine synthase-like glycosyltransferase